MKKQKKATMIKEAMFAAFADELEKIALSPAFFKSPIAKNLIGGWNAVKGSTAPMMGAAGKMPGRHIMLSDQARQQVQKMRLGKRAITPPVAKATARPPMAPTAVATTKPGRSAILAEREAMLKQMKARVNPALTSPQVRAAHQAEADAASGKLMAGGMLKIQSVQGVGNWFSRNSGHLTHAAEVGGLGVLAVPSAAKLRKINKPETTPEERRHAKFELAGLGILAAPSVAHLAHSAYKFGKSKLATSVRVPVGSRMAAMRNAAFQAVKPPTPVLKGALKPPMAARPGTVPRTSPPTLVNQTPERARQLAAGVRQAQGTGHKFTPKSGIDLPAAPKGPMVIERGY